MKNLGPSFINSKGFIDFKVLTKSVNFGRYLAIFASSSISAGSRPYISYKLRILYRNRILKNCISLFFEIIEANKQNLLMKNSKTKHFFTIINSKMVITEEKILPN